MIKNFFLIIFVILILIPSVSAVVINEIMYDPLEQQGGDTNGEWIEIYNDKDVDINLSGWVIKDKGSANTSLEGLLFKNTYAIIADNITNFNYIWNCSCLLIEGNFRLSDSGDEIWLWNETSLVDYVNYSSIGSEGNSLQLCNGILIPNIPTPGTENNCTQQGQQGEENIELDYLSEVDCNEEFSIEIEVYNFEDDVYDIKIDILGEDEENIDGKVWDPDEDKWQSTSYYVNSILKVVNGEGTADLKFKIEDYEGEAILRPKIRDSEGDYEQFDDYFIDVECNIQEESEIKIKDAPENARFGDEIEIEIEVYRGDTAKYAVYVYVWDNNGKKVSDEVNLHFDEKFETKTEKVELILKCKNEQGTYEIIAEGLDTEDKENIDLESCEEQDEKTEETKSELNTQETTTAATNYYPITSNSILESDSFLLSKLMPYILTSISLLLVIYLIIKKI